MADHVYRRFTQDDLFETQVFAQPLVTVESGTAGYYGYLGNNYIQSASLSLYGGVRSRSDVSSGSITTTGLELYPIDIVDTNSIDKVIGVPGMYPATGSITIVTCTNTDPPNPSAVTQNRWYNEHYRPIQILFDWYNKNVRTTYHASASLTSTLKLIHIPSMFYGRQIAPNSVYIYDNSYNALISSSLEYIDDGIGNLIVSGTDVRSKVGNVFYNEGLIVFTNPIVTSSIECQFGTGQYWNSGSANILYHVEFKGSTIINSKVFMCRMGPGDVNASNNVTYWTRDGNGRKVPKYSGNTTYITSIGIYNEERQLVAVAKLAQPIRKRERDRIDVRLRIDF